MSDITSSIHSIFLLFRSFFVAPRASTTAREISIRRIIGNFNGLPVIDNDIKLIGIVMAVDILRTIRQGKNLDTPNLLSIVSSDLFSRFTFSLSFDLLYSFLEVTHHYVSF